MADDDKPYEVGYGKPPKASQFPEGQSGNVKGRPKGSQNLKTSLRKAAREFVPVTEGGRTRRRQKQDIIVTKFINDALTGSPRVRRDCVMTMKQFEDPEDPAPATTTVPKQHQPVIDEIIRTLLENHTVAAQPVAAEHNSSESEPKKDKQ